MKPAPFEYVAPANLDEALEVLSQNSEAKVLAGGQSLMPLLNFRLAKPKLIIDLSRISGLGSIREGSDCLSIGAMARQCSIERSSIVRERCPILAEAARYIGHVAIRHRGTIGGSLVHADPAAELPAIALLLDAKIEVARGAESRTISAEDFFIDYLTTAVACDEIVTEIVFPFRSPASGYAVEEIARRHGDFAIAGVATILEMDARAEIAGARIALFGVAPTAVRARRVEAALKGQKPTANLFRDAAALIGDVIDPLSDIHASSAYRKHVARVLTIRALEKAALSYQKREM